MKKNIVWFFGFTMLIAFLYFAVSCVIFIWGLLDVPTVYVCVIIGTLAWAEFARHLFTRKVGVWSLLYWVVGYTLLVFGGWHAGSWESLQRAVYVTHHCQNCAYTPDGSDIWTWFFLVAATIAGRPMVKKVAKVIMKKYFKMLREQGYHGSD